MPNPTGPSNPILVQLIKEMKENGFKTKCKFLLRIAEELEKPTRSRVEVNVSKINRYTENGETIIVPGKVLSSGLIDKKVTVAAWDFSEEAEKKIIKAGGKVLSIEEFIRNNPEGKNTRIMC